MKITIRPQDTTASILQRVQEQCPMVGRHEERFIDCCTIIDEFHANMLEHVAPKCHDFEWHLSVTCSDRGITLVFQYHGPCFDPTQSPDIEPQPIELRRIGGLGLAIISQLSDSMDYVYENGLNTLTIDLQVTGGTKEDPTCH